jgi:hypothetical protein
LTWPLGAAVQADESVTRRAKVRVEQIRSRPVVPVEAVGDARRTISVSELPTAPAPKAVQPNP